MKHKIFLSYSHKDVKGAEYVAGILEKHGFPCFMASRDMEPGANWGDTIQKAIQDAQILIVVAGEHTFDSHQIIREIAIASQEGISLLIASLAGPVSMGGNARYYLAYSPQYDMTSEEGVRDMLAKVAEIDQEFSAQNKGSASAGKPDKPYEGKEPYIFISYSHKDMSKVFRIIRRLQDEGYRVWYDEGIDPATEWDENIAQHIADFEATSLPLGMSMRLRRLQAIHEYKYEDREDFYSKLLSASGIDKCK